MCKTKKRNAETAEITQRSLSKLVFSAKLCVLGGSAVRFVQFKLEVLQANLGIQVLTGG